MEDAEDEAVAGASHRSDSHRAVAFDHEADNRCVDA